MTGVLSASWVEILKIRRSILLPISVCATAFVALVMGFLMFVLKNPEIARQYGLLAAKASLAGSPDWPSYLAILGQAVAGGGIIGFGFLATWIFGREYADKTYRDSLALPASRASIVVAKLVALFAWCAALSVLLFAFGMLAGYVVDLDAWSADAFFHGTATLAGTSVLVILLLSTTTFFASAGRGFLPALGFVILAIILAQVMAVLGYGQFFPWAVPALLSGAAGPEAANLGLVSYMIVLVTSGAGIAGTILWWRYADQP